MKSTATLQSIWVNLLHRVIVFYDVLNCCLVSKVMTVCGGEARAAPLLWPRQQVGQGHQIQQ